MWRTIQKAFNQTWWKSQRSTFSCRLSALIMCLPSYLPVALTFMSSCHNLPVIVKNPSLDPFTKAIFVNFFPSSRSKTNNTNTDCILHTYIVFRLVALLCLCVYCCDECVFGHLFLCTFSLSKITICFKVDHLSLRGIYCVPLCAWHSFVSLPEASLELGRQKTLRKSSSIWLTSPPPIKVAVRVKTRNLYRYVWPGVTNKTDFLNLILGQHLIRHVSCYYSSSVSFSVDICFSFF